MSTTSVQLVYETDSALKGVRSNAKSKPKKRLAEDDRGDEMEGEGEEGGSGADEGADEGAGEGDVVAGEGEGDDLSLLQI